MPKRDFEGTWRYRLMSVNAMGQVTMAPERRFTLPTINEGTGDVSRGTDDDGSALNGRISEAGPFRVINLHHPVSAEIPERHLRGVLAFQGFSAGEFRMVVVGARRNQPFPMGFRDDAPEQEEALTQEQLKAFTQEDGTWIAVKP